MEIKAAFREKAKTIHPDIAGNGHTDGRTFTELREAYEILMSAASTSDVQRPKPAVPFTGLACWRGLRLLIVGENAKEDDMCQ